MHLYYKFRNYLNASIVRSDKFAFDPEQASFALKKVLPARMVFPYDFGFLHETLSEDGDPIDLLLRMDEPAFSGYAVRACLIGVIEGEQLDGKKRVRNDPLLAVAGANHMYANIKSFKASLDRHLPHALLHTTRAINGLEGFNSMALSCWRNSVCYFNTKGSGSCSYPGLDTPTPIFHSPCHDPYRLQRNNESHRS